MGDDIHQWFVDHDDGEFALLPRAVPYSVVPPMTPCRQIVYTTKPASVIAAFSNSKDEFQFGVIGRYGLPHEEDMGWLKRTLAGHKLLFLGDLDPCDLLIFAWLRARIDLSYCGLNDWFFERCRITSEGSMIIEQSPSEVAAIKRLTDMLPEYVALLGPDCTDVLLSGRKIELEAFTGRAAGNASSIIHAIELSADRRIL